MTRRDLALLHEMNSKFIECTPLTDSELRRLTKVYEDLMLTLDKLDPIFLFVWKEANSRWAALVKERQMRDKYGLSKKHV